MLKALFRRRGPWDRKKRHIWPAERRRQRRSALLTLACFLVGAVLGMAYFKYPDVIAYASGLISSPIQTAIMGSVPHFESKGSRVLTGTDIRVIDGDTVRLRGESQSIRLVGFNTGEISASKSACAAEIEAGKRAKTRLHKILNSGSASLVKVPCACPRGTEGTQSCNYGRACGVLRVDGQDVGDILIREGLAAPYVCSATRCPKPPNRWC